MACRYEDNILGQIYEQQIKCVKKFVNVLTRDPLSFSVKPDSPLFVCYFTFDGVSLPLILIRNQLYISGTDFFLQYLTCRGQVKSLYYSVNLHVSLEILVGAK